MHSKFQRLAVLALLVAAAPGNGEELVWRPAAPAPVAPRSQVTLGRPEPLQPAGFQTNGSNLTSAGVIRPVALGVPVPMVVRGQMPEPPPPPPPPASLGTPVGPAPGLGGPGEEAYNCGVANTNAPSGTGFFSQLGDKAKSCWDDVTGSIGKTFQAGPGGGMFKSDHGFDVFISPVSNPFYFVDPRSLTELRPVFIWQNTPNSNPVYAGGDNFFVGLTGSLAFNEWLSLTLNKIGYIWSEPHNSGGPFQTHVGLTELHLGPKVTFIRNDNSGTLVAAGLIFEIPVGPAKVFQNTGNLSLDPYFSIGQNFLRSQYGSFNFLNTTGYSLPIDNQRSDFLYASFHLDYDVGNLKKIYPLVELNYAHYPFNGGALPITFEGRDMFNFGANQIAGRDFLTVAVGARYKINESIQFGLAAEFGLLNRSHSLDDFRITIDMIFRY